MQKFEAAREGAYPKKFVNFTDALEFVRNTPVSADGTRPWIRIDRNPILGSFMMIGGRCDSINAPEPEFVTAEVGNAMHYGWKCDDKGIIAYGDTKKEATEAWQKALVAEIHTGGSWL